MAAANQQAREPLYASPNAATKSTEVVAREQVRVDAVCFVYTCRRLIDLSLIAGRGLGGGQKLGPHKEAAAGKVRAKEGS